MSESDDKAQIGHAQFYPCSPLPRENFPVANTMPNYLGKDQRKIEDDEKKDDKPIQGKINMLKYAESSWNLLALHGWHFSQYFAHGIEL